MSNKMALCRSMFGLLLSLVVSLVIATATDYSANKFFTERHSLFDPNIDCDVAKLALDYAKKLQPFRESFDSVYYALGLQDCNVTNTPSHQTK